MSSADTLVIIPTYNEIVNIGRMVPVLMNLETPVHLLVVDDGSPDGTAEKVEAFSREYPGKVHLLNRGAKLGLGTAYVAGFKYALERDYQFICEMDADFSHDPHDLVKLIQAAKANSDSGVVIGSRYCKGISIINWPLSRLILSYSANLYARFVTGLPIFDTTAGFKCIRRNVLESINIDHIRSNGYAFQIEVHFRAWKAGNNLSEVSIIFREREEGVSKMSGKIVREAMWRVWALKLRSIFGML